MIDADVLVEEGLELFVLVVQLSCFVYQLLPGLQQVVVFGERFIQHLPNSKSSFWEHLSHLLPIFFSLPCN